MAYALPTPYPWLLDLMVPIAPTVVGLAVALEAVVAALLFTRQHQQVGLWLATAWVVFLIPAIAYPYWLANVLLAGVFVGLAVTIRRSPRAYVDRTVSGARP